MWLERIVPTRIGWLPDREKCMYPHGTKLSLREFGLIDIATNYPPSKDGGPTIVVALESYAGSGDVSLEIRSDLRRCEVIISPDNALIVAEALTFYANASKRIAAQHPRSVEANAFDPAADWMGGDC
jgi:hypothetical protein